MKVALITSWNERCSVAEYAKNLITNCQTVEFEIISNKLINSLSEELINKSDIVHVNYEPRLFKN